MAVVVFGADVVVIAQAVCFVVIIFKVADFIFQMSIQAAAVPDGEIPFEEDGFERKGLWRTVWICGIFITDEFVIGGVFPNQPVLAVPSDMF